MNTYRKPISNPFRMNTYEKTGGGGHPHQRSSRSLFCALASLFRSLAKEQNVSPFFPSGCSLFAKNNRGVRHVRPLPFAASPLSETANCKPSTVNCLYQRRNTTVGGGGCGVLGFCCEKRPGKALCKSQRRVRSVPPVHFSPTEGKTFFAGRAGNFPRKLTIDMAGQPAAQKTEQAPVEIKLAHSPDSDDAFMFYALATHKLATPGYKYTHVLSDIQTLNEAALTETYDVTAVSFAAYPSIRDKYVLLDCGASFGEGYGPVVVSAKSMKKEDIKGKRIGVPGLKTTAYLALKLYEPDFEAVVMPFDKILDAVQNGLVEGGLLIHEGQLLFPQLGLHQVLDLGGWWQELTGLPVPLGGNG